jgi:hypothetical protein
MGRLILRVPPSCPACAKVGTIVLQETVETGMIVLDWSCNACDLVWPVTIPDPIELRTKPDRRKTTRNERRRTE